MQNMMIPQYASKFYQICVMAIPTFPIVFKRKQLYKYIFNLHIYPLPHPPLFLLTFKI